MPPLSAASAMFWQAEAAYTLPTNVFEVAEYKVRRQLVVDGAARSNLPRTRHDGRDPRLHAPDEPVRLGLVPGDASQLHDLLVRAGERARTVVVDNGDPQPTEGAGEPFRVVSDDDEIGPVGGDASTFGVKPESDVRGAAFG